MRTHLSPVFAERRSVFLWLAALAILSIGAGVAAAQPESARSVAEQLIEQSGATGGLVVHIGCGDGKLTAALRIGESFVVQGLDGDPDNVAAARSYVQSLGCYGPVSVAQWSGGRLPYVDNLVRLAVVEDAGAVEKDELLRVLAPLGVAWVRKAEGWQKIVKPWPEEMDEWPQHFYGPENNAVGRDKLVGPPRHYQWINQPEWMRSHMTMPSINSMVSSRGRLFTIEDQGSAEHPALPGKFALVARDAFNGMVLWQRRFPDWHPINIPTKNTPVQLQRRLAAIGEVVYCTPGYNAPITALDAATGKELKVYEGTEQTREFVYDDGLLLVVVGDQTDVTPNENNPRLGTSAFPLRYYGPVLRPNPDPKSSILAVDAESGRVLWRAGGAKTAGYLGGNIACCAGRVVYATKTDLVCLDRNSGKELWRTAAPTIVQDRAGVAGSGVSLVLSDRVAYLADSQQLRAFSLENGKLLWQGKAIVNHHKPADVFLAAGLVWSAYFNGYDPLTGQLVRTLQQQMTGPMGHDRCYRNRITERYYINTKTGGSDFLPLDGSGEFPNPWVRSTCGIGHLPCNGLLYVGPPACSCCNWVMLNAMNALATEPGLKSSAQPIPVPLEPRLEKGPAYGQAISDAAASAQDWPTYRHDAGRTGVTRTAVPAQLKACWQARVSSRPSAPVIAAGKVFVADIDAHAVCAFDAASGRRLWSYTTGGRVDSPPTYYKGLLLFGSHDGWLYCLRAADGQLVWRFKELPERTICAYGQPESAWPVPGSVLVKDETVYFAAGRNSFLDGGIFVYGLDPQTGRVRYRRQMYGPYGEDGFPIITSQISSGSGIDGCKNDVFLTDGKLLYLRQQAFRDDLTPLKPEQPRPAHLIPSPGFLESIPHHRTFWTIDTTIRYDIPAGRQAAHGDILVLDGKTFFEVRGYTPARISPFDPRENGYALFAGVYKPAESVIVRNRPNRPAQRLRIRSVAEELWTAHIPLAGKALVLAGDALFVAGTPVAFPRNDLARAYEGRMGGLLWAVSKQTGEKLGELKLGAPPMWDGMAAAGGRLYVALADGRLLCLGGE